MHLLNIKHTNTHTHKRVISRMFPRISTLTDPLSAKPISSSLPWLHPPIICVTMVIHPSGQRFPSSILALAQSLFSSRTKMLFTPLKTGGICRILMTRAVTEILIGLSHIYGPKSVTKGRIEISGIIFKTKLIHASSPQLRLSLRDKTPNAVWIYTRQKAFSMTSPYLDGYKILKFISYTWRKFLFTYK